MKHTLFACLLAALPISALAQDDGDLNARVVQQHILPGFATLAQETNHLATAAQADCTASSDDLKRAYGAAFDAWIAVSHLRFGPTETNDRAFALAFWPDSRGATPKSLAALIRDQDPIANSAAAYTDMSIAARGFYALEFLLYDDAISTAGDPAYRCQLVQTITADIAALGAAIDHDWRTDYADRLQTPTADGTYRSDQEVLAELFKALTTGLEFTSDTRMGRPLGTFEKPRPTRAEARRSGRSAHHVATSLTALNALADLLAQGDDALTTRIDAAFNDAQSKLAALNDPVFAGVADPQTRFETELVKQSIDAIRTIVRDGLGPKLGVAAGFNALDGD